MKCFACGAEKDLTLKAVYPYEGDCLTTEVPIPQLLVIDCQSRVGHEYRMAVMCQECWHRLEMNGGIDMWIGQECWESLKPVIPFERLPFEPKTKPGPDGVDHEKWKAENYALTKK